MYGKISAKQPKLTVTQTTGYPGEGGILIPCSASSYFSRDTTYKYNMNSLNTETKKTNFKRNSLTLNSNVKRVIHNLAEPVGLQALLKFVPLFIILH